jgi:hypothetical protein
MKRNSLIFLGIILFTLIISGIPPIIENNPNATNEPDNKELIEELKNSEWVSGYNYSMNTNAPYSWIEINETGTNITSDFNDLDDGSTGISFSGQGWNFTFYGTEYNTVNVSTNGFMCFSGQGNLEAHSPLPVPQDCTQPTTDYYNDTAFLLYSDFNLDPSHLRGGGSVFYKFGGAAPNRYLVIEYFQVNNYSEAHDGDLIGDFEAIFYENGDIKFQYKLVRDLVWNPGYIPVVGLDHGDLINYSNYTENLNSITGGDVEELAVYFRLNRNYTMDTNADYSWYELRRDGAHMTWLSNRDDDYENITFIGQGWNFTFYDTEYINISVSSNGWMSFTNLGDTDWLLDDIPSAWDKHQDCVSLFCTDIDLGEGGDVYYYFGGSKPNRYLIIEYYRAVNWDDDKLIGSFEVIFHESGNIKFQYQEVRAGVEYDGTIIGLDHGDLTFYNNYTPYLSLPLTSKAIKFIIDASAEDLVDFVATLPPPSGGGGDDDDDDDEEAAIPGPDIFLVLSITVLAIIALAFKLKKKFK